MNLRQRQHEQTREAILEALGALIVESGSLDFSMQDVANRAGVTHRTVYNHFPTRQALNDAFGVHVEAVIGRAERERGVARAPDDGVTLDGLPEMAEQTYRLLVAYEGPIRAYVMLMMASGAPAKVASDRTERFAQLIEAEGGPAAKGRGHLVAAAMRMFLSSMGFHMLTAHHGLEAAEASAVGAWAIRAMVAALRAGDVPAGGGEHDADERGRSRGKRK